MAESDGQTAYALSADKRTLVIKRRLPAGIQTVTLHREDHAGPFTGEDVAAALGWPPGPGCRPGQRNISRRAVTGPALVDACHARAAYLVAAPREAR